MVKFPSNTHRFLIDSSSSVGKTNFLSEIKFVKKMLGDFTVSLNHTRVAIVTFSSQGKVVSYVYYLGVVHISTNACTAGFYKNKGVPSTDLKWRRYRYLYNPCKCSSAVDPLHFTATEEYGQKLFDSIIN